MRAEICRSARPSQLLTPTTHHPTYLNKCRWQHGNLTRLLLKTTALLEASQPSPDCIRTHPHPPSFPPSLSVLDSQPPLRRTSKPRTSHDRVKQALHPDYPSSARRHKTPRVMSSSQSSPGPGPQIPTAASSWTKSTLDLLNAEYDRHMVTDFQFEGLHLPDDLQNGMHSLLTALHSKSSDRSDCRGLCQSQ